MKNNTESTFIPYSPVSYTKEEMIKKSKDYLDFMTKRRSVRSFSSKKIPFKVIENIIQTAGLAPSGANKQPWSFCVIADKKLKKQLRTKVEEVEKESYERRMSEEWLNDLEKFETNWKKPFIEEAPYLIIVFKKVYNLENGAKTNNYYVNESVGIALGFLISAIHQAGLVTVTHTPSPMNFLHQFLDRPSNERAYMLLPVGYPIDQVKVPNITKKSLEEIMKIY